MTEPGNQLILSRLRFDAVLFDLDGVITKTAKVHAAAWRGMFDPYLRMRAERDGTSFESFDVGRDYRRYIDGKPRYEGVKDFLLSRGIELPFGSPDDHPGRETVGGRGNRKNALFQWNGMNPPFTLPPGSKRPASRPPPFPRAGTRKRSWQPPG